MKARIEKLLNEVGITVNGNQPYDIQVHDDRMFTMIATRGSVGAGEAYMDGLWDCERLDELFFKVCKGKAYNKVYSPAMLFFRNLQNSLINQQSPKKSIAVAKRHYNLGNRMYERMLGKSMAYTCGYWKNAQTLDEAQFAKYELTCQKLHLQPGDTVLEIGCGWGGLAKYMAEHYGCEVVAIDIGDEPARYAKELCKEWPVKIFQCDYRDTRTYNPKKFKFNKIVSVGVLEHIGFKNYQTLVNIAQSFLQKDGIALLHTIGGNASRKFCEPWIDKYIFPNGMLPSLKQLGHAYEEHFIVEDHHNFGAFYDMTLLKWNENLNNHWSELKSSYNERFHRMMNYYLLSCAGGFRARDMQLWQFVLTPSGLLNGYQRIC